MLDRKACTRKAGLLINKGLQCGFMAQGGTTEPTVGGYGAAGGSTESPASGYAATYPGVVGVGPAAVGGVATPAITAFTTFMVRSVLCCSSG